MKKNLQKLSMLLFVCFGLMSTMSAQNVVQVAAGDNVIGDEILFMEDNIIIELTTPGSEGVYTDSTTFKITKLDITIRAAAGMEADKPIIDVGMDGSTFIKPEGGFTLDGVIVKNGKYIITPKPLTAHETSDFSIRINNCDFIDNKRSIIYTSDGMLFPLDSIFVTNTTVQADKFERTVFYYKRPNDGQTDVANFSYLKMENCLIVNVPADEKAIEFRVHNDNTVTDPALLPKVIIDHVTISNCDRGISGNMPGVVIMNSVIDMKKFNDDNFTAFDLDFVPVGAPDISISNCIYTGEMDVIDGTVITAVDSVQAQFVNVGGGDFSLVAGTAGTGAASDGLDMGYIGGIVKLEPRLPVIGDPSFETDTTFTKIWGGWGDCEINTDANFVFDGAASAKILDGGPKQWIKVEPSVWGSEVSLIAWAKSEVELTGSFPTMVIQGYDKDENRILNNEGHAFGNIYTDKWMKQVQSAIIPEGTTDMVVGMYTGKSATDPALYVDDFHFVFGDSSVVYDLITDVVGTGTVSPAGTTGHLVGDIVSVTATPDSEWHFIDWSGASTSTEPTIEIAMLAETTLTANFGEGNSVKAFNSNDISVYPNPTNGLLYLSVGDDIVGASSLEVFDITGKVVYRNNNLNGQRNVNIDLSSAPSGLYFGMLKSDSYVHSFKILKN